MGSNHELCLRWTGVGVFSLIMLDSCCRNLSWYYFFTDLIASMTMRMRHVSSPIVTTNEFGVALKSIDAVPVKSRKALENGP